MAPDGDSKAMHFVEPNVLHRSGLSVGEDHCLADKLDLGLLELAKHRRCPDLHRWHLVGDSEPWFEQVVVCI